MAWKSLWCWRESELILFPTSPKCQHNNDLTSSSYCKAYETLNILQPLKDIGFPIPCFGFRCLILCGLKPHAVVKREKYCHTRQSWTSFNFCCGGTTTLALPQAGALTRLFWVVPTKPVAWQRRVPTDHQRWLPCPLKNMGKSSLLRVHFQQKRNLLERQHVLLHKAVRRMLNATAVCPT